MTDFLEREQPFRPAKRRKLYRKRDDDDTPAGQSTLEVVDLSPNSQTIEELLSTEGGIQDPTDGAEASEVSVAAIIRQRKAAQRRRGGIEFTNSTTSTSRSLPAMHQLSKALVGKDDILADMDAVVNRFAPQTGQVADVDRHMMAYIDTELAKRRQGQDDGSLSSSGYDIDGLEGPSSTEHAIHRQPAALGKLHEIDLGPDATLRNIARTEAAKKKLEGGLEEPVEETGRIRLRKDGKPYRGRRRRNSDDVKRDRLVEEVLRESRLEIYDEPDADGRGGNDDQAADDRLAEQFRREFMDAVQSRRQKTGPATATKPVKGAKVDDKPKGPKLGGSRSARAAMREQQEKAAKK